MGAESGNLEHFTCEELAFTKGVTLILTEKRSSGNSMTFLPCRKALASSTTDNVHD